MNISKKELLSIIKDAYFTGMNDGYGIEHTNIYENEENAWLDFFEKHLQKKYKFKNIPENELLVHHKNLSDFKRRVDRWHEKADEIDEI